MILTAIGTLLLLLSLGGIVFGAFMAADPNTREAGRLFVLGWVPAVAAASGVLMRDAVTFAVGLLCFLVAGAVFTRGGERARRPSVKRRARRTRAEGPPGGGRANTEGHTPKSETPRRETPRRETSERETTEENKPGGYGRAAS